MKFDVLCGKLLEQVIDLNLEKQNSLNDLVHSYSRYLQIHVTPLQKLENDVHIVQLSTLRAHKDAPKGIGTAFMVELCKWADTYRTTLVLQTATKGDFGVKDDYKKTSSIDRLKKFYGRFGFKSNYGKRTYRPDLVGNMFRAPKS